MSSGIVLIDKPVGITSHDAVYRLRKILGTKKVGHAGTLDPLASGLLVLGFNSGTRLLHFLVGATKQYTATIRLGASTTTDDSEGEIIERHVVEKLSETEVDVSIQKLTGKISQTPSSVSAIKVDGKRAYDLVREGQEFELKARDVEVSRFVRTTPLRFEDGFVDFDVLVDCSSGTYIRALARDLGKDLGIGGHITALRRTKVANFEVESANSLDSTEVKTLSLAKVAETVFPVISLTTDQCVDLVHGKRVLLSSNENQLAGIDPTGELLAILESAGPGNYKSLAVFPKEQP